MKTEKKYKIFNIIALVIDALAVAGLTLLFGSFFDATKFNYIACSGIYLAVFVVPSLLVWFFTKLILKDKCYDLSNFVVIGFGVLAALGLAFTDSSSTTVLMEVIEMWSHIFIIVIVIGIITKPQAKDKKKEESEDNKNVEQKD